MDAIRLLFWSAVANALFTPPLIILVFVVCDNGRVMGEPTNGRGLNTLGGKRVNPREFPPAGTERP